MPETLDYPVMEIFVHGHWEPWAVFFTDDGDAWARALLDAIWKLRPLRYRVSGVSSWGGFNACYARMNKAFNHRNN
jgi:hypothetical protein